MEGKNYEIIYIGGALGITCSVCGKQQDLTFKETCDDNFTIEYERPICKSCQPLEPINT